MLADADFLILDGYNIINSWGYLKNIQTESLEHARQELENIMSSYGSFKGYKVIIVYDGQGMMGASKEEEVNQSLNIVFTSDGLTADSYIERRVYDILRKKKIVYVVTGDYSEQLAILGTGAYRQSVRELREDYERSKKDMLSVHKKTTKTMGRNELAGRIGSVDVLTKLENMRRNC